MLKYRHDKGTLTAFNFSYFGADSAANIANCKPAYEKAKELGILDHAYIYGFDECGDSHFPALEKSASDLKKAFPEVSIITTALDRTFGNETVAKSIDAWCPLTTVYSVSTENADKARKAGKKVWWYIACIPGHPFANWWVEYPAIDARLLMGAMATKFRPDGFLYYALALWWNNNPITSGPYTNWDPVSWKIYTGNGLFTYYHGDGSLLCAGPGGKPLPTIRLENYRDGMEDYAYARILEEIIGRYEAMGSDLKPEQARWLKHAKDTLPVPGTLVKSLMEYSQEPKELYNYRERLSDLIDSSGMANVDPWGKDFGPRGFKEH